MVLPDALRNNVEALRATLRDAYSLNAPAVRANASTYIDTILSYVLADPRLEAAAAEARSRSQELASELEDQGPAPSSPKSIENARGMALNAVDALAMRLAEARPSDLARALGLDWY